MSIGVLLNAVAQAQSAWSSNSSKANTFVNASSRLGKGNISSVKSSVGSNGLLFRSLLETISNLKGSSQPSSKSSVISNIGIKNSDLGLTQKNAMMSFMQSLMSALQVESLKGGKQNMGQVNGAAPLPFFSGLNSKNSYSNIETGLQNLINDLSSSNATSNNLASGQQSSLSGAITNLKQASSQLFSTTGVNVSNSSLVTVLKNMQQALTAGLTTGNLVSLKA